MNSNYISLRSLVDKWLAPTRLMPARVTQVGRLLANRARYVRPERHTSGEAITIIFFRHDDGSWCVFQPLRQGLRCAPVTNRYLRLPQGLPFLRKHKCEFLLLPCCLTGVT
ncbi:hypothetical protein AWB68_00537 [Caballeronia choica]|jgi:hypothetical protein|uniref:Uncharacterized protein n=1 Tax=Caballeronia choica TaxID=326476 RepID=A0A158FFX1_9BURK|nr:hypothetical protein [Caballeronia choica]SAL17930.1 hypothetical protein AWB68_00537 [Caballeronia choica]